MILKDQANQTNEAIKQTGEFTVSVRDNVDPFVIANFGFQSSRRQVATSPSRSGDSPVLDNAVSYASQVTESRSCRRTRYLRRSRRGWARASRVWRLPEQRHEGKAQAAFQEKEKGKPPEKKAKWVCSVCGYVYDGDVPFEDLPDDWTCPLCGAPKSEFEKQ